MQQQAISIPQFELNVVSNDETVLSDGVQVELAVELSLKETKPPSMIKKGSMKLWASIASITSDGEFIEHVLSPPLPFSTFLLTSTRSQLPPRPPRQPHRQSEAVQLLHPPRQAVSAHHRHRFLRSFGCVLSLSLFHPPLLTLFSIPQPVPRSRRSTARRRSRRASPFQVRPLFSPQPILVLKPPLYRYGSLAFGRGDGRGDRAAGSSPQALCSYFSL
jgi:hypothetical protein